VAGNILHINAQGMSTKGILWAIALSCVVHAVAVRTLPGIRLTSSETDDVLTVELDLPTELIEPRDVVEKETVPVPQQPSFSRPTERGINPPEDTPPIPLPDLIPPVERPRMDIPAQAPDVVSAPASPDQSAPVHKAPVSVPVKRVVEQIPVEPIVMNEPDITVPVRQANTEVVEPTESVTRVARRDPVRPVNPKKTVMENLNQTPQIIKPSTPNFDSVQSSSTDVPLVPPPQEHKTIRAARVEPAQPVAPSVKTIVVGAPAITPPLDFDTARSRIRPVAPVPPVQTSQQNAEPSGTNDGFEAEVEAYRASFHQSLQSLIKKDQRRGRLKIDGKYKGESGKIELTFDERGILKEWRISEKSKYPALDKIYENYIRRLIESGALPSPPVAIITIPFVVK